jgi:hypothetical protein
LLRLSAKVPQLRIERTILRYQLIESALEATERESAFTVLAAHDLPGHACERLYIVGNVFCQLEETLERIRIDAEPCSGELLANGFGKVLPRDRSEEKPGAQAVERTRRAERHVIRESGFGPGEDI